MELKDKTKTALPAQPVEPAPPDQPLADPVTTELAERPLPDNLRYLMLGLLVAGVVGVVSFGYIRQTSVKPAATTANATSCKDVLTENRLRETLKQSPNDYPTLMDWGDYNFDCEKNYQVAVAAFNQALTMSEQPNTTINAMQRTETRFRLGLSHLYNSNPQAAQQQFAQIVKEDPQNTSALLALGVSYEKQDPAKALSYFNQVIQLDPNGQIGKQAQGLIAELNKPQPTK